MNDLQSYSHASLQSEMGKKAYDLLGHGRVAPGGQSAFSSVENVFGQLKQGIKSWEFQGHVYMMDAAAMSL